MYKDRGFTLIELLVVISIIAILTVIGMVAYGNFLKNSRDAKRQSDLKMIQSALEAYHADQIYYPLDGGSCPATDPKDGKFRVGCALTNPDGTRNYMTEVPKDPRSPTQEYLYVPSGCTDSKCTGYCLSAQLEGVDLSDDCTPASGYNYGVTRP